jgi:hypothetical protein
MLFQINLNWIRRKYDVWVGKFRRNLINPGFGGAKVMKKILAVSAVVLSVGMSGISLAASPSATPTSPNASSPLHQLGMKFRTDMIQIQKDVKSGKLTQAQATEYRNQLKTIRKQEMTDVKTNGNKTLTADQESTLMSQLATVEQSL